MLNWNLFTPVVIGVTALTFAGCENLPGTKGQQGAVIGGASGAAVGAAVGGSEHRAVGAIVGGVLGAAGGYVVGANSDKILGKDNNDAETAATKSRENPAKAEEARNATTADVNRDGYVTLDEVAAMKDAGFSDEQMLRRLEATGHVFDLTDEGKKYLRDHGVSENVINGMQNLNQQRRETVLRQLDQSR